MRPGNLIEEEDENEEEDECGSVHGGSVTKGYYRFLTVTMGDYRFRRVTGGGPRIVDKRLRTKGLKDSRFRNGASSSSLQDIEFAMGAAFRKCCDGQQSCQVSIMRTDTCLTLASCLDN